MRKFKSFMAKIIVLIICIFQLTSVNGISTFADANTFSSNDSLDAYNYFSLFFSGEHEIQVTNKFGLDVTDYFVTKTQTLFYANDIDSIDQIIADEDLLLCITTEESVQTYALEQYKTAYYYDVTTFSSTDRKYSARVSYTFNGGFWYNPNTYQVTRTSDPVFDIVQVDTDINVKATVNSISTGSYPSNGKAYFWATFKLSAGYYLEGAWIKGIDFNTSRISFNATP